MDPLKKERFKNWFYYHKWPLFSGIIALLVIGITTIPLLRTLIHPADYTVAYVGSRPLSEGQRRALADAFTSIGKDASGDGQVIVEIREYILSGAPNANQDMVADQLAMDISSCDSLFFLMEDPESFQASYGVLRFLDGKLPPLDDYSTADRYIRIGECPSLTYALDGIQETEKEFLCGLSLGVRGFWTNKTCKYEEAGEILWKQILECLE